MLALAYHSITIDDMIDKEPIAPTRIKLGSLEVGEILEFATKGENDRFGRNDDVIWTYLFYVTEAKEWPSGNLWAISPNGEISEVMHTSLHGCGKWTTQKQNPVQKQLGKAFTPVWGELVIGCYPTFDNPDAPAGDRITLNGTLTQFEVKAAADYAPNN